MLKKSVFSKDSTHFCFQEPPRVSQVTRVPPPRWLWPMLCLKRHHRGLGDWHTHTHTAVTFLHSHVQTSLLMTESDVGSNLSLIGCTIAPESSNFPTSVSHVGNPKHFNTSSHHLRWFWMKSCHPIFTYCLWCECTIKTTGTTKQSHDCFHSSSRHF